MLLKSAFVSFYCISVTHGALPRAGKLVRDEGVVGPLAEHYNTIVLSAADVPNPSDGSKSAGARESDAVQNQITQPGVEKKASESKAEQEQIAQKRAQQKARKLKSIRNNLDNHRVVLHSFRDHSKELSDFLDQIKIRLDSMKWLRLKHQALSKGRIDNLEKMYNILKSIGSQLITAIRRRFADIGGVETPKSNEKLYALLFSKNPKDSEMVSQPARPDLPKDVIPTIMKYAWKNYGDMIVESLKPVIKDNTFLYLAPIGRDIGREVLIETPNCPLILQRAGLKTIDWMINHEFANPQSVRNIFHDHKVVEKVITYTYHYFNIKFRASILDCGPTYLTEHWYWHLLHDCFRVLSEKEERRINISLFITRLSSTIDQASEHCRERPDWLYLKSLFDKDSFWTKLEAMEHLEQTPYADGNTRRWKEADLFYENAWVMIHLLLMPWDLSLVEGDILKRENLDALVVDGLNLIERYISPGIIKRILTGHRRSQEFQDRFKLLTLASKFCDLVNQATFYHMFENELIKHHSLTLRSHKAAFNGYVNQLGETLSELKTTLRRVRQQGGITSTWVQYQPRITRVEQLAQNYFVGLKEISKTFLTQSL